MSDVMEIEIPRVEIDFMNEDHLQVINLVNDLLDLIDMEVPELFAVAQALTALLEDCRAHFAREEQLMQEYVFPPYGCHKREHDQVLEGLVLELSAWQQHTDKVRINSYMNNTFITWLGNHVATMDTVTAHYVAAQQRAAV